MKHIGEKFSKKKQNLNISKALTLPRKIDNRKTSAKFEKGRLKITIPKTIFRRKIKIK